MVSYLLQLTSLNFDWGAIVDIRKNKSEWRFGTSEVVRSRVVLDQILLFTLRFYGTRGTSGTLTDILKHIYM